MNNGHPTDILLLLEEQKRTNQLLERLVCALESGPQEPAGDEVIVGVRAICKVLNISANTFGQMRYEGGLPVYRLPGDSRWRLSRSALNKWIARRAER